MILARYHATSYQIGIYSIDKTGAGWRAAATGPGTIGDGHVGTFPTLEAAHLQLTGEPLLLTPDQPERLGAWITLACPHCGTFPTVERGHGGGPDKIFIACDNLSGPGACMFAPSEVGEDIDEALTAWETRP